MMSVLSLLMLVLMLVLLLLLSSATAHTGRACSLAPT
jgi:hypothetical protein